MTDDTHVLPNFGRPHQESSKCWCRPTQDPITPGLWIHNLEN